MSHKEPLYTSDLTDEQWERLKPLLPLERSGRGRPLELDLRSVIDAIFYILRTGCQWDELPKDYPNHNSVYYHYAKWRDNGTWRQANETLRQAERTHQGRTSEPSAAIVDSQSVKTTEVGGDSGYDAGRKSRAASATSWSTRSAICSKSSCMPPTFRTAMAPSWCWTSSRRPPRTACASCGPTAAMPAP